jgi:hypothetical protein
MPDLKLAAVLDSKRSITLYDLPFQAGANVDVTIRSHSDELTSVKANPLWGMPLKYDEPCQPVAQEDWEILQ